MTNRTIPTLILFFLSIFFIKTAQASGFNPNYIISDSEMLDYDSMSLEAIQNFLEKKNSYLATYETADAYGEIKSAAEIIYNATNNNYDCEGVSLNDRYDFDEVQTKCTPITTVNPKFILVLLQKEMSLIEDTSPTESQLNWATGYGCPDGAGCNATWKGFGKQVNSASLQFKDYMDSPHLYSYKKGETYTFTNPYSTINNETNIVTIANQATAALYNYTPHVYNGNYNFYNLWQRYFTIDYPDGSLLQVEGEPGVWLIQNGQKRPFLSKGALTSRFDENKIITVSQSDIDKYETGSAIKFPNYSILRSPKGDIYLLVDDSKREFADDEAFRLIGYNPEEVVDASWEDLNIYEDGADITASSTYPMGALLQDNTTGGVYWVIDGTKAPIIDRSFLTTKFKNKNIIPVSPEELANYEKIDPVLFDNGELLKSTSSSAVYLIADGKKRAFTSGKIFESMGYKWENVITTSPQVLYLYDEGEAITEI